MSRSEGSANEEPESLAARARRLPRGRLDPCGLPLAIGDGPRAKSRVIVAAHNLSPGARRPRALRGGTKPWNRSRATPASQASLAPSSQDEGLLRAQPFGGPALRLFPAQGREKARQAKLAAGKPKVRQQFKATFPPARTSTTSPTRSTTSTPIPGRTRTGTMSTPTIPTRPFMTPDSRTGSPSR